MESRLKIEMEIRKHVNVLVSEAALLWPLWVLLQRSHTGRPIISLAHWSILYYMLFRARFGASVLWRLERCIDDFCLAVIMSIDPTWVESDINPANALSREI